MKRFFSAVPAIGAMVVGILLVARPLGAQDGGQTQEARQRVWSVVLQVGKAFGGPSDGLVGQLRSLGFDDTKPAGCLMMFCTGPIVHPTRERPGGSAGVVVRYAFNARLAVGGGYSSQNLGGSTGYRKEPVGPGLIVSSVWHAKDLWLTAFYSPSPGLRIGGGPAWYQLGDSLGGQRVVHRIGVMAELGIEIPPDRPFFLGMAFRYHAVPSRSVEQGGTNPVELRPAWSHSTLEAGFGIHL